MPTKKPASKSTTTSKTSSKAKSKSAAKPSFWKHLTTRSDGRRSPVLAILIVLALMFVGYFAFVQSNADSYNASYSVKAYSELGCKLVGRVWDGKSTCQNTCKYPDSSQLKYTDTQTKHAYCTGYVNLQLTDEDCISTLHRYYVTEVGCSRRANQKDTNDSIQCIPNYPNYKASGDRDMCVKNEISGAPQGGGAGQAGAGSPSSPAPTSTNPNSGGSDSTSGGGHSTGGQHGTPPTDPSTGGADSTTGDSSGGTTGGQHGVPTGTTPGATGTQPTSTAPPETNSLLACNLLGRKWDAAKKACTATCQANTGLLVTGGVSGTQYCNLAVSTVGSASQFNCVTKFHRLWLVEGCARRADQKDMPNAIQCQPGFAYYNADYIDKSHGFSSANQKAGVDVCEVNLALAEANELAGTPGATISEAPSAPVVDHSGDDQPNSTTDVTNHEPALPNVNDFASQTVDYWLSEDGCHLRGRSYLKASTVRGVHYKAGCSRQECFDKNVKIFDNNGHEYCEGYINRNTSQAKCNSLHRIWAAEVEGCATNPDQSRTKPLVDAAQCVPKYPVYVFHSSDQGYDECLTQSGYQYLQGVAKKVSQPIAVVASWTKGRVCRSLGLELRDGKCKHKIVPQPTASGTSSDPGSTTDPTGGSTSPNPPGTPTAPASTAFGSSASKPLIVDCGVYRSYFGGTYQCAGDYIAGGGICPNGNQPAATPKEHSGKWYTTKNICV